MSDALILELSELLSSINRARASRGEAPIKAKDWSTFLSGVSNATVRKAWIDAMRKGDFIAEEKALAVLAAINAVLKKIGLPTVKASSMKKKSKA